MSHIQETIPDTLDPLQFAYRQNRSTDDSVNTAIHTALTHLEGKDTYLRMLFTVYRSAFHTVIPTKLAGKLLTLGLTPRLCNWVLNFLTDRLQLVRIGSRTSSTRTVSTETPQGCVLSPLLYTLFTYDCVASQSNTSIIKFADDTTVIGPITGGDETAYRREVAELVDWCDYNNLSLNTDKTKEMIVDPRRRRQELHTPLFIGGKEVERVKTFKFLGVHISEDLAWSHNTHYIVRKSQQQLYFLRRLRKFGMSAQILSNFYRSTIESVLTSSITVWYGNCTAQDRKALQRVIKTSQSISGAAFPSLKDIYRTRVIRRAHSIIRDSTHPQHSLFTLLPSGRRYRMLMVITHSGQTQEQPTVIIKSHQDHKEIVIGDTVTLKCEVPGGGGRAWTYIWYKNGEVLSSQEKSEYTFQVTAHDDAQYTCKGITRASNPVTLPMADPPRATLTVEPRWSLLFTGESVTLRCEIQSYSNWRYQWYKGSSRTAVYQSQTNTFTIRSAADQDQYWCRGERDDRPTSSQNSNPVTLTVEDPPRATLTVEPESPLFTGESVTLKCEIQSYSNWRYQWYKGSSRTAVYQSQTNTFTIRSAADQDQYWCRGERDDRPTSSQNSRTVTLTVEERPTPAVSIQPGEEVFRGETVTLRCVIQGGGVSNWEYSWSKGGSSTPVSNVQQYSISSVTQSHSGTYTCRGTVRGTSRSSHTSKAVTLSVSALPTPTLTIEPRWSPLFTGESVTLRCEIQSYSNWRYQWYKGSSGTAVYQSQTNTFTIRSAADQDQYWCRGERDNRPTSSQNSRTVTLTVEALPRPTLTVEPRWSPLFTGESVTLKCEIQSYSNWRYQWYKGSSRTAVSHSQTYTFTIRSAADQDQYWCRGERDNRPRSSQNSRTVTLTVEDLPRPTLTVEPESPLFTGESVTLKCEDGFNPTPFSNVQYSISSVTQSHSGTYTCIGTVSGTSRSSHTSKAVTLSVSDLPRTTLTLESKGPGELITLKCEIQSYSNWTYLWYKGSSDTAVNQSQTNTFTTRSAADEDQYWCRGERDSRPISSQNSNPVTLTLTALPTPTLTVEPDVSLVTESSSSEV
ncbi:hypothetical protein NFI96_009516 [Prochilodus magdalenae]|nr:hypothetical protein NFI96_009516 [Prochilodus magdalenae]